MLLGAVAVGSYLNKDLCNRADVAKYVTERTQSGKLGMKTGSGVFSYTPEKIAELRGLRAKRLVAAYQSPEVKSFIETQFKGSLARRLGKEDEELDRVLNPEAMTAPRLS